MKLGVLGIDRSIAAVVAAAHRAGDTISLVCDVEGNSLNDEMFKGVPVDSDWEALLGILECVTSVAADFFVDGQHRGLPRIVHPLLQLVAPILNNSIPWPSPLHVQY